MHAKVREMSLEELSAELKRLTGFTAEGWRDMAAATDDERTRAALLAHVARFAYATGVQAGGESMARTYSDALAAAMADPSPHLAARQYEVHCPGCSKDLGLTQTGPNRSQVIDPEVIAAHYAESPACGQILYLGANRTHDPEGRPGA